MAPKSEFLCSIAMVVDDKKKGQDLGQGYPVAARGTQGRGGKKNGNACREGFSLHGNWIRLSISFQRYVSFGTPRKSIIIVFDNYFQIVGTTFVQWVFSDLRSYAKTDRVKGNAEKFLDILLVRGVNGNILIRDIGCAGSLYWLDVEIRLTGGI